MNSSRCQSVGIILSIVVLRASGDIRYVDVNSTNPTPPYTNWATAATTIQDAEDAAAIGDRILVTNGVYNSGGRVVNGLLTNRVAVTKALAIESVNGKEVTIIEGYQVPGTTNGNGAMRCVYLATGSSLTGFTVRNGATRLPAVGVAMDDLVGGGVWVWPFRPRSRTFPLGLKWISLQ